MVGTVPNCASNVTGQFHIASTAFLLDSVSTRFVQKITITNATTAAVRGPIILVLDNLSANVSLFNASGVTSCAMPSGRSYVTVASGLEPGSSSTAFLPLSNPSLAPISSGSPVLADVIN